MLTLFRLWSVALYEVKTLFRTRVFLISLFLASGAAVYSVLYLSPVWGMHAVSSSVPLTVCLAIDVVTATAGIFIASRFLENERREHTTSLVYARSFSNISYVIAKALAVILALLILDGIAIVAGFAANIVFITDTPVFPAGYVYYPFIILFPAVVWTVGLVLFVNALIPSHALAVTLLAAGLIFQFTLPGSFFDSLGIGLPILASDIAGFGNPNRIILQRIVYFLIGCGCIFTTSFLFRRPSQLRLSKLGSIVFAMACFACAGFIGLSLAVQSSEDLTAHREMLSLSAQEADQPMVSVTDCILDLVHKNREIEVTASLRLQNDSVVPIKTYFFSLNPGLTVFRVACGTASISFTRKLHLLVIQPSSSLPPGGTDSLVVHYRGTIDERVCTLDVDEAGLKLKHKNMFTTIEPHSAFLAPTYVLLTADALWYPVPGVPDISFDRRNRGRGFVRFTLRVKTKSGLTAISQGKVKQNIPGEWKFIPEYPLPRISLAIGRYEKKAITVDGIEYAVFYHHKHNFFSRYFPDLTKKEISDAIREEKNIYESNLKLDYPFPRFSIVETPIQYIGRPTFWKLHGEAVQPEIALVPEKGITLEEADFERMLRSFTTSTMNPQQRVLRDFIRYTFLSETGSRTTQKAIKMAKASKGISFAKIYAHMRSPFVQVYNVFPNYTEYNWNADPGNFPLFDLVLKYGLLARVFPQEVHSWNNIRLLDRKTRVHNALNQRPLIKICVDISSGDDAYDALLVKVDALFREIESYIGTAEFDVFCKDFLRQYRFRRFNAVDFFREMQVRHGVDFSLRYAEWLQERGLTDVVISDIRKIEAEEHGRPVWGYSLTVSNPGSVTAIIQMGIVLQRGVIHQMARLKPGEAKMVGIVAENPHVTFGDQIYLSLYNTLSGDMLCRANRIIKGKPEDLFEGEQLLTATPSERGIVIDDNDEGFSVIAAKKRGILLRFMGRETMLNAEPLVFEKRDTPGSWRKVIDTERSIGMKFWGFPVKTAYIVKGASGSQRVCWTGHLPEAGMYDVYCYAPSYKKFIIYLSLKESIVAVKDFHFLVNQDEDSKEVTIDMSAVSEGWVHLGAFHFSQGPAKVELTNRSKGRIVFADAVKWVKK